MADLGIIFLRRRYPIHWYQSSYIFITGSMPFRYFWATLYIKVTTLYYYFKLSYWSCSLIMLRYLHSFTVWYFSQALGDSTEVELSPDKSKLRCRQTPQVWVVNDPEPSTKFELSYDSPEFVPGKPYPYTYNTETGKQMCEITPSFPVLNFILVSIASAWTI